MSVFGSVETDRNPDDPAFRPLGTFYAYNTEEQAQGAQQLANAEDKLGLSRVLNFLSGSRAHGLPIEIAIWPESQLVWTDFRKIQTILTQRNRSPDAD